MVYLRAAMLLLVLLCGLSPAAAQPVPPNPRQVTVFDGLPSNTVNRMAEDRYGYLWIATNDGPGYDGRNYRIWRSEDGLRDNRIWTVLVDARNQLWIGTENAGLVRMSADRRQLHSLRPQQPAVDGHQHGLEPGHHAGWFGLVRHPRRWSVPPGQPGPVAALPA